MSNGKDINDHNNLCDSELFYECNCLSEVLVTSDYIFNIDATKDNNPNIAVTTANKSCLVYSLDNNQLANIWESKKEKSKLIGCKYSSREKHVLYIGNSDGVIKIIDLRTPENVVVEFTDTTAEGDERKTFNCFDVSTNDRLLAAGTDVLGGDAFVLFWDIRNKKLLGGYWESHTDDVTQVRFHPDDMNKLISGSTDGLINLYDLSQTSEDDALIDTLNTESSVNELQWFTKNNKDCISCVTHTSDLQLWDLDKGEPYQSFSREDLITKIMSEHDDDFYLAKFHQLKNSQFILGGSHYRSKEYLRALSLHKKGLEPYLEFKNNQQKVRDSAFNEHTNILVTGGEKGVLNIWKISDPSI
ncbi:WD repeat-containing protein 89 [Diabrotica undecimpunctata]|uniref:WD repeat-containing protein 89 n=1 Tax=Diabrotica undecimpunctata TaxID=50387 RepID=UPI003B637222